MNPTLSTASVEQAFPFVFGVDRDGLVAFRGPAFRRVLPEVELGMEALACFTVRRPAGVIDWPRCRADTGRPYLLQSASGLVLRGHWLPQDDDGMLFLGSPAISSLDALQTYGLRMSDFAPHDGSIDGLFLLQSREAALADAKELQERLERRGAELDAANQELRDQQNAVAVALRESAEKSSFLAGMSHELRTPLNAIIGYAELLLDDADDAPDPLISRHGAPLPPGDVQRIHRAAQQLLTLINDILDIAKVESGRLELHPSTIPVQQLLDTVEETMRPLARAQGTRCSVSGSGGEGQFDVARVRQILLNLLANALRATPGGAVSVSVRREEGRWLFVVDDNGSGMEPGFVDRLFRPFEQGKHATAAQRVGGTGLGLTISRLLARRMHGDIEAQSVLGEGSTFTLWLPAP